VDEKYIRERAMKSLKKYITFIILILMFNLVFYPGNIKVYGEDFFKDVPPDHWAYQAILYLYNKGLIKGYSDGTFKGDKPMTRYEIAFLVYNILIYLEDTYKVEVKTGDFDEEIQKILAKSAITEEEAKLIRDLINEFRAELVDINNKFDQLEKRVERLENNYLPLYLSIGALTLSVIALVFAIFN
jgi:hypothetical protein